MATKGSYIDFMFLAPLPGHWIWCCYPPTPGPLPHPTYWPLDPHYPYLPTPGPPSPPTHPPLDPHNPLPTHLWTPTTPTHPPLDPQPHTTHPPTPDRVLCTVLVTIPWAGPPSLISIPAIDKKMTTWNTISPRCWLVAMWWHHFATFDDIILQHLMTSFWMTCTFWIWINR